MDRRHAALAAAVTATLADDCKEPSYSLFDGSASLDVGPETLKGHETRAWVLTAEVYLPPEAEDSTYESVLEMDIAFSSGEASWDASFVVSECDSAEVKANLSFPRDYPTSDPTAESIEFERFLADCPIQECVRTLCVDVTNHRSAPLELWVGIWASLRSDVHAEEGSGTIDVPIDLTLEEIEP